MSCSSSSDLEVVRGSSFDFRLIVTDDNGDPVDIAGCRVWMCVLLCDGAEEHALEVDSDVGGVSFVDGGSGGDLTIELTSAATADLTSTEYLYEVWIGLGGKRFPLVRRSRLLVVPSLCPSTP